MNSITSAIVGQVVSQRVVAQMLFVVLLSLIVVVSALGVVSAKHQSRKLFVEMQSLQREGDLMAVEWGQLQLEQSSWATHGRIEEIARERLGMVIPAQGSVVMLRDE